MVQWKDDIKNKICYTCIGHLPWMEHIEQEVALVESIVNECEGQGHYCTLL